MDRQEFIAALKSLDIDPSAIVFDSSVEDGYGIRKNYYRWEIYRREHGKEYFTRGFPSESEAYHALLYDIINAK